LKRSSKNTEKKSKSSWTTFSDKFAKFLLIVTNSFRLARSKPRLTGSSTSRMWTKRLKKPLRKASRTVLLSSIWWSETRTRTFNPFPFSLSVLFCSGMILQDLLTSQLRLLCLRLSLKSSVRLMMLLAALLKFTTKCMTSTKLKEPKFWLAWKSKRTRIEDYLKKRNLDLSRPTTTTKSVMIQTSKSTPKKFSTTYTNGVMKSQRIQQKINGRIHPCFGRIKRNKNLSQNQSTKIGLTSVNFENKSKTLTPSLSRFRKLSHHIRLVALFLTTALSNKPWAKSSFCGKTCSWRTSKRDAYTNLSRSINYSSPLRLIWHLNLKTFMSSRKTQTFGRSSWTTRRMFRKNWNLSKINLLNLMLIQFNWEKKKTNWEPP